MILSINSTRKENWSILLGFKVGVVKKAESVPGEGMRRALGYWLWPFI